jgi:hypothetical protein
VNILTKELSYDTISPQRNQLRDVLIGLHEKGLNSREIADYLNAYNSRARAGKEWYHELVWVTINKWKKRQKRLGHREVTIGRVQIEIISGDDFCFNKYL